MNTMTRLTESHTAILRNAAKLALLNSGLMPSLMVRGEANVCAKLAIMGLLEVRADGCYWITREGRAALESEDES